MSLLCVFIITFTDISYFFFDFQPSFYHLHVHFTFLKHEAPGIYCERRYIHLNITSAVGWAKFHFIHLNFHLRSFLFPPFMFSHLLSTVINNIELIPDYYQRAAIPFVIKESDPHYQKYRPDADTVEPLAKKPKIGE